MTARPYVKVAPTGACLQAAAALGGDVRVGFENSLTDATGAPWPSVAASVSALTKPWRAAA